MRRLSALTARLHLRLHKTQALDKGVRRVVDRYSVWTSLQVACSIVEDVPYVTVAKKSTMTVSIEAYVVFPFMRYQQGKPLQFDEMFHLGKYLPPPRSHAADWF